MKGKGRVEKEVEEGVEGWKDRETEREGGDRFEEVAPLI